MWSYKRATGELRHDGVFIGFGYSGKGQYKNEPDASNLKGLGPIPAATYSIGPGYQHKTKGPVVMNLTPEKGSIMYGRNYFEIHGDSIADPGTASDGCIVLARVFRELIASGTDRRLQVV